MENTRRWLASRREDAEKTILVVEDNDALARLFVYIISVKQPFRPLIASDARQALSMIRSQHIDLCILEHCPSHGMDSIALYDQIRGLPYLENIPTIIVSANLPAQEIAQRHIIGLPEPFRVHNIRKIIHTLLA